MSEPKRKPDAEEMARATLWHLAGLRAEVRLIHVRVARLAGFSDEPQELADKLQKAVTELQMQIYREEVREVGLPIDKDRSKS